MQPQSSLGVEQIYKAPSYTHIQIGHITSTKNYKDYGIVEVVFLDHSQPFPVWANGTLDKEPTEGDTVLVGFIQGRYDYPYVIAFVRNKSYTANFITVEKDRIIIQLSADSEDLKNHLLDDSKKASRPYIEVTSEGIDIHNESGVNINGVPAARVGDTVSVTVPGYGDCTGTITSGATK
jgi:hypothetical protein